MKKPWRFESEALKWAAAQALEDSKPLIEALSKMPLFTEYESDMTEEAPKVVDLRGRPVESPGQTPAGIIALLEQALRDVNVGTYKAVAIILIDEIGQPLCSGLQSPGIYFNALVGGIEVMKHRILTEIPHTEPVDPEGR